jgi:hypothetical protein
MMLWIMWKQQNARVFSNVRDQCNVSQLVDPVHDEFKIWMSGESGSRREGAPR